MFNTTKRETKDDPCDDWSDHPIPKAASDKTKHVTK